MLVNNPPGDTSGVEPARVKEQSESVILRANGKICAWLPVLNLTRARDRNALVGRALTMNALLNIHFGAPVAVIRDWIDRNGLRPHLSAGEVALITKPDRAVTEQERINLYWYIEGVWALMWAGGLIADLPFDQPAADTMASLVPNLQQNENGAKFEAMRLRPYPSLFAMLDLYYRLHWYARDGQINRYSTAPVTANTIWERRKALEWLMDNQTDWDNIDLGT